MTAAGEPRTVPMEALLEIAGAARTVCRRHGVVGEDDLDRVVPRTLAAAAGIHAGLEGLDEAAARRLQLSCAALFKRAYECSAAAGQQNRTDGGQTP